MYGCIACIIIIRTEKINCAFQHKYYIIVKYFEYEPHHPPNSYYNNIHFFFVIRKPHSKCVGKRFIEKYNAKKEIMIMGT